MVKKASEEERRTDLLKALVAAHELDTEGGHVAADKALLDYIGDAAVSALFNALPKWYA